MAIKLQTKGESLLNGLAWHTPRWWDDCDTCGQLTCKTLTFVTLSRWFTSKQAQEDLRMFANFWASGIKTVKYNSEVHISYVQMWNHWTFFVVRILQLTRVTIQTPNVQWRFVDDMIVLLVCIVCPESYSP